MAVARKKRYPKTRRGLELTPEAIENLAEEAERGYDLSTWRRQFVTRPLSGDVETWGTIEIRVFDDEINRLRVQAEAEERTIESLVREAALLYLESKGT